MKKVAVLLAPGFEEAEAIITIDILRRLHIEVETLACAESRAVVSYHNIPMVADHTLVERSGELYDAVVLPGGPQGSVNLAASADVIAFVKSHDGQNKLICPICSAAARVLGGNGLLNGRRYVCSGDLWEGVSGGEYVDAPVVEDGNLLSGKGLGHAFDFAFALSARLLGDDAPVRDHADHIYYAW
jgi:DJ-1 family protein